MNLKSFLKTPGINSELINTALKYKKQGQVDLYLETVQKLTNLANRPLYDEIDYAIIESLPEIPRKYNRVENFEKPIRISGRSGQIINESGFSRMELHLLFLDMFNKQHGYGLDLDSYPRTHYEFDGIMGAYEVPRAGTKNLPTVTKGSRINDVMYANAHEMWNQMDSKVKKKLEPIYMKIWKRSPTDVKGLYSPGERAFAVSKDIQTTLYERFMNDNRFTVKDYDEWCYYVDDIPDDILVNLAKKVHGSNGLENGYWYEKGYIDTSEKGIEALRETLKYRKGGKAKLIPKRGV